MKHIPEEAAHEMARAQMEAQRANQTNDWSVFDVIGEGVEFVVDGALEVVSSAGNVAGPVVDVAGYAAGSAVEFAAYGAGTAVEGAGYAAEGALHVTGAVLEGLGSGL